MPPCRTPAADQLQSGRTQEEGVSFSSNQASCFSLWVKGVGERTGRQSGLIAACSMLGCAFSAPCNDRQRSAVHARAALIDV